MKKEADVKAVVKKTLTDFGAWWFMPVMNGYGRQGIPDFICCIEGKFFSIETKFGTDQPSALQQLEMNKITEAGGVALLINEKNWSTLPLTLAAIRELSR